MTTESQAQSSLSIDSDPGVPGGRALAAWEIASLVSSALIAEWILSAAAGRTRLIVVIPLAFAFVLVITSHFLRRESRVTWDFDSTTFYELRNFSRCQ